MALEFSVWPGGAVEQLRTMAQSLSSVSGRIGDTEIAQLRALAKSTVLFGFGDSEIAACVAEAMSGLPPDTVRRYQSEDAVDDPSGAKTILQPSKASIGAPTVNVKGHWIKVIGDVGADGRHTRSTLVRLSSNGELIEQGLFWADDVVHAWNGRWREETRFDGTQSMIMIIDNSLSTLDRINDDFYCGIEVGPIWRDGVQTEEVDVVHIVAAVRLILVGIDEVNDPTRLPATLATLAGDGICIRGLGRAVTEAEGLTPEQRRRCLTEPLFRKEVMRLVGEGFGAQIDKLPAASRQLLGLFKQAL